MKNKGCVIKAPLTALLRVTPAEMIGTAGSWSLLTNLTNLK